MGVLRDVVSIDTPVMRQGGRRSSVRKTEWQGGVPGPQAGVPAGWASGDCPDHLVGGLVFLSPDGTATSRANANYSGRHGNGGWATFKNPDWPANYICSTDEFWSKQPNEVMEEDRPILAKGEKGAADYSAPGSGWGGARDLDHTNPYLREDIKSYLRMLKGLGYRGWRYDMVKGYDPNTTTLQRLKKT